MVKIVTLCALAIPFVIIGLFLWMGKGSWLIAGYNTSGKEEKAQYDEKALCRFVAKLMIVVALFMVILAFTENTFIILALTLFFIIFIFGAVIYANTGNRFKKK